MKLRSALIKLFIGLTRKNKNISDKTFVSWLYFISFGKFPDIDNPKTLNEHICRIKISDKSYDLSSYADKVSVREYIKEKIGEDYLTPSLGVYTNPDDIPFDLLPTSFVMKCSHASGYNILVKDKSKLDIKETRATLKKWLETNYYTVGREKNYKNISPAVLIEEYISDFSSFKEYKIFCFGGKPKFIELSLYENGRRCAMLFDMSWDKIPATFGYPLPQSFPEKPANLPELVSVTETLSGDFEFVRVDLLSNGEKLLFGELSFTPGGGLVPILPKKYDALFGSYFK